MISPHANCTEACAAMPVCATCGMKKHPRGRDPGVYAASGYCGHGCPGFDQAPVSGHLWPSEWRDELARRAGEGFEEDRA